MMNRIDMVFKRLKKEGKKAFIPYIAAGDPDLETTEGLVHVLSASGADIIELGIPFSDPLADGPTIQASIKRSLDNGFRVKDAFTLVRNVRKKSDVPVVFMTYYNIIFSYGIEPFVRDSVKSGADGVIVPDLPMEESEELMRAAALSGFCVIMLTAPTTGAERFSKISSRSKGFIYYVSVTGVTGARKTMAPELRSEIAAKKKLATKPLCVGFGVSDASQAREISRLADGVIVGSAIIRIIEKNLGRKKNIIPEVGRFTSAISRTVHGK